MGYTAEDYGKMLKNLNTDKEKEKIVGKMSVLDFILRNRKSYAMDIPIVENKITDGKTLINLKGKAMIKDVEFYQDEQNKNNVTFYYEEGESIKAFSFKSLNKPPNEQEQEQFRKSILNKDLDVLRTWILKNRKSFAINLDIEETNITNGQTLINLKREENIQGFEFYQDRENKNNVIVYYESEGSIKAFIFKFLNEPGKNKEEKFTNAIEGKTLNWLRTWILNNRKAYAIDLTIVENKINDGKDLVKLQGAEKIKEVEVFYTDTKNNKKTVIAYYETEQNGTKDIRAVVFKFENKQKNKVEYKDNDIISSLSDKTLTELKGWIFNKQRYIIMII